MTNEEAFRKWRTDYESDYDKKPSYLEVWQAAIAYMQEKSEPVGFIDEADEGIFGDVQNGIAEGLCKVGDLLYTTPQRQQPLNRLSQLDVLKILNECAKSPYTNTQSSLGFANAIMDEMERINK